MRNLNFLRVLLTALIVITFINLGFLLPSAKLLLAAGGSGYDCDFCFGFPCRSGGCCCYGGEDDICYCFAGCLSCGCQYLISGAGYNEMCPVMF